MKKALTIAATVTALSAIGTQNAFAVVSVNIAKPPTMIPGNGITIPQIVIFVLTLLVVVAVIAAIVFLIYGGIKWITSGGDKAAVESARNHIVAAIIGLVVIILAFVILSFVLQLLGVNANDIFNLNINTLNTGAP